MKKLVFICLFTFLFNFSKAQCDWVFTNCIDCELTIEFCWVDGGAPVCTTMVLQPGCLQDCSTDTFSLPSQFCSGSGNYFINLITYGITNCVTNCDSLVNGHVICCDQIPPRENQPACVDECQCARIDIFPFSIPPKFIFSDLTLHGTSPCPKSNRNP